MRSVLLCILDGWGVADASTSNAITNAYTPNWEKWTQYYPYALLDASGPAVGLPEGQMGNSEVGHLTIGAGRAFLQDLPRINQALERGTLQNSIRQWAETIKGTIHVFGLFSDGGVHAHMDHMGHVFTTLKEAEKDFKAHLWLDGRDTPPQSALSFLTKLPSDINLATVCGRYYSMDRDQRWDRVKKAYEAIVHGKGSPFSSTQDVLEKIKEFYAEGIYDEFIPPLVHHDYTGIQPEDGLIFTHFRADRMKQLLSSFFLKEFDGFKAIPLKNSAVSFIEYDSAFNAYVKVLLKRESITHTLPQILAQHHLAQFHSAETEKFAHVTYFFNGGKEEAESLEERVLVPSPKVSTYDQKPEMEAQSLTLHLKDALLSKKYTFLVVNFANPDMVGHTGNYAATVKAIEYLDVCLGEIAKTCHDNNITFLITSDHGNCEEMVDPKTGNSHTAHTCNPVPFLILEDGLHIKKRGSLQDVAPTILDLLGIAKPKEMTGESLIVS